METVKWTLEVEICKLAAHLEFSRENYAISFNNFKEDGEDDKINTMKKAHEPLLNDKYQLNLFDDDIGEIRRGSCSRRVANKPPHQVL